VGNDESHMTRIPFHGTWVTLEGLAQKCPAEKEKPGWRHCQPGLNTLVRTGTVGFWSVEPNKVFTVQTHLDRAEPSPSQSKLSDYRCYLSPRRESCRFDR
jgi:hypothetical protein